MGKMQKYCTFFLNQECFGVEVEKVQEVIVEQPFTPVHLAPDTIKGMINLRGQIVVVMDLRSRLEYPSVSKTTFIAMILILKHKEHYIGFLVDSVGEVLEVDTETFHTAPETLRGAAKEMILGSYKLDKVLLKILNVESMKDFKIAI